LAKVAMTDVIVIPDGQHSPLGPSSAERWMNCPGSTGGAQTEYAAEGTAAHTLSEWVREGKPLAGYRGKILKVGDFEFKVGKNMIDSVQTFVDACATLPGAAVVEDRVSYEDLVTGGFGTLDAGAMIDWLAHVKDFKHGKGVVVAAKENAQLKLYALGLYFKYRWIYGFSKFILSICQPRVHHFDEWEVSLGQLLQWGYDEVRPAALRVHPQAERKAGPWCKFCGHKNDCPVRAAYKISHETGTFRRDASEELVSYT
jgi:Protein of unknown function (DUF2800)